MRLRQVVYIFLCGVITSGCACYNNDIIEIDVVKPKDKYLNCQNLNQEILRAEFEHKANLSRMEAMPAYVKNPTCLVNTQLQIERAANKAKNRLIYLEMLKKEKNCP